MTTRSAKLYQGEDKSPVYDYTDSVVWEESEFGTRAWQGEGSASSIVIRDPLGEQGNELLLPAGLSRKSLAAKNLFVVEVDSSTLFRGRVGIKNYSRDNQHVERYRQVECSLHDTNWDLDHIFVHQYARPSETDKARAQGLIASYLSTSPRATTALNGSNYISGSNLVTLPAQTYNRTSPLGVLREIAGTANKQFFVTGDAIGGGSLFYDGNDSTAYACTFTISDRESEVRAAPTTTFPPIWNVGPASTEDGSELASHLRLFYGTGEDSYVTASSATVQNQYSHASETVTDDTVTDAANAQSKANARLAHRQYEDKNYNVTIGPLTDAQVVLVKHGMTINIKARAIPDADDQLRLMRIVQCRYTTPIAGTWFAHLQLGRPWKMAPYGTGPTLIPQPPTAGSPALVESSGGNKAIIPDSSLALTVGAQADTALYVALIQHATGVGVGTNTVTWCPNFLNQGTQGAGQQSFTKIADLVHTLFSNRFEVEIWRLLAPTPSGLGTSAIDLNVQNADNMIFGYWFVSSVDQTTPEVDVQTAEGSAQAGSSVTVSTGGLVLDTAGWLESDAIVTSPTPSSGQTTSWSESINEGAGQGDLGAGGGYGSVATVTWDFANSHDAWLAAAVSVRSTGTPTANPGPIGGNDETDIGTDDGHYALPDHGHPHSDLSDHPAETHHHASSVKFTPTGTIAATDVQTGMAEIATEYAAADSTHAAAADPHTGYVLENILTTAGDVPYATAANTWTRRAIGASNFHLVTDGVSPLWAAQSGGAAALIVQEDDVTVDAAAGTLDFTTALNVTSSPAGEANIAVDLGTGASQAAAGNHTHTAGDSSKASATADYTPTTTTATDVTGASLSLAAGTYVVAGNFDVTRNGATNDRTFEGVLDVNAVDENDLAVWTPLGAILVRSQVVQVWRVTLASTLTVKLQARHSGGTAGDFTVNAANTTLTAWVAGGAAGYAEGTSFPGSPASGDKFFHNTYDLLFFYDGTRWLTTTLYTGYISNQRALDPITASSAKDGPFPHPSLDIYVETYYAEAFVATTNTGTQYWTFACFGTTLSTISNAASTWLRESASVNAVVANVAGVNVFITKVSTPGGLYSGVAYTYRLVGV